MKQTELLKGILEGLVLTIIQRKETYGHEVTKILNDQGFTEVAEGTTYTILLRLEKNQRIIIEKRPSEKGSMRKLYHSTSSGKAEFADFWQRWTLLSEQVNKMKKTEGQSTSGFKTLIKKVAGDKKEYKEYKRRIAALPAGYQQVFREIEKYARYFSDHSGANMLSALIDLLDLFEEGVANGTLIENITGKKVGDFAEAIVNEVAGKWTDKQKEKLSHQFSKQ